MSDKNLVLPVLIAQRAAEHPDRVFVDEVGGGSLTYAQFNDTTLRWAEALRRVGVTAGDRVVTMLPSTPTALCAWLGVSWLRAVEVPCNTAFRGRMLGYLIANSDAHTIVIADRYLDRLAEVGDDLKHLRSIVVIGTDHPEVDLPCRLVTEEEFLAGVEPAVGLPEPLPSDLCALLYTSGTTGNSKGVRFPWAALYAQVTGYLPLEDFNDSDVWYMPYPMHHMSGKTPVVTMVLLNGRIVIRNGFDTKAFWSDIDRYGCTSTALLGTMTAFLWQQEPRDDDAQHVLKNVYMTPLVSYVDEFNSRFGTRCTSSYGSTENSVPIRVPGWASSANWKSCGKLRQGFPGYEVRIVDENDYEVPAGEVGELIMRTSEPWTLNLGYFGLPDKTVEAWRNGWFHTGDAMKCDEDGNFFFVDRINDCIRRRGENISSFEVEAEVNSHPLVSESVAVGVPSELGEEEIKILVVRAAGAELTEEELVQYLIPRMARFMVPRYVEFVDEFPKTEASFRIRKHLLRANGINEATWDREAAGITVPR